MTVKQYDQRYFDRWYRHPRFRIGGPADLERKVRLALSVAEYVLGRAVRNVLDVGCGEGRWQPVIRRLRPRARYIGVDSSPYVVRRYGRRRNIRLGGLGELETCGLDERFDLVVCADVLHYVPDAELARGLRTITSLLGGVAFLETYTSEDAISGDRRGFHTRSAAVYRRLFRRSGLVACGLHCYVDVNAASEFTALEQRG